MKNLFCISLFLMTLGQCIIAWGQSASPFSAVQTRKVPLFVEQEVQRFGLTRSWFNQIALDQRKFSIRHVLLQDGTVFIVSCDARLHAIDAETGATLWVVEVGDQETICMAPSANSRMVGLLGGTNLQIFDRKTGRKLWENTVSGVPGAGCVLSEKHVYLPLASGRILAWPLEEEILKRSLPPELEDAQNGGQPQDAHDRVLAELRLALDEIRASLREKVPPVAEDPFRLKPPTFIPMECQSFGLSLIQPIITAETETDEYLVWPTVHGDVYFGSIGESVKNTFALLYRVRIAPQAYSYDSAPFATENNRPISTSQGLSYDWVAPRTIASQLTYSPRQVLSKEESEKNVPQEEMDDPFAKRVTARSKFAAPQFGDFDDDDIFGGFEEDDDDLFGNFEEEDEEESFFPEEEGEARNNLFGPVPAQNGLQNDLVASQTENGEEIIPSMILVGNVAGFVVAINDFNGEVIWKFVAANPVYQRVVIVKKHVYACTLHGGMYCLNAKDGEELWYTEGITQFIAESNDYVYALNFRREIAILDRKTGRVQTTLPVMPFDFFLENHETDRIYAGTENGLLQCLREIHLPDPVKHRPNRKDLAEQLQAAIAEAGEQRATSRPADSGRLPTPIPVPDFGRGFDDDERNPFGETEDDFDDFPDSFLDDDDDFGSMFD